MVASRFLWSAVVLAAAALAGGPVRAGSGAELYELCAQCHGVRGEGNQTLLAPAIAGLPEWYVVAQVSKFKSGLRGLHPDDVAGLRMHPMARALKSDEDIQKVAAHVAGLAPTRPAPVLEGGDSQRGAELFAPCVACHGPDASGNQALLAPPLHGANDWYLLSSLQRYKAGVRAANLQNANAQIMRGMAALLVDEQAMKDVIAYIMTLSDGKAN